MDPDQLVYTTVYSKDFSTKRREVALWSRRKKKNVKYWSAQQQRYKTVISFLIFPAFCFWEGSSAEARPKDTLDDKRSVLNKSCYKTAWNSNINISVSHHKKVFYGLTSYLSKKRLRWFEVQISKVKLRAMRNLNTFI